MDVLRRIFGLQPAPKPKETASPPSSPPAASKNGDEAPVSLEGPTAPLEKKAPNSLLEPVPTKEEDFDPSRTKIPPEDGHTHRLPDLESSVAGQRVGRHITFGIYSDIGQVRTNNQDAIFSLLSSSIMTEGAPEIGLFVVADGMGGHHDGERASAIAARTVARYAATEILMPMLGREEASAERPTITEILKQAIQQANLEVSKQVPEGGTTVTAAAIIGDLAYVGHVGDSRAYILEKESVNRSPAITRWSSV